MKLFLALAGALAALGLIGVWLHGEEDAEAVATVAAAPSTPSTVVRSGEVVFNVTARGELQGSQSVMLTAPMTGSAELVITDLRTAGELVQEGDVAVEFDITELTFNLREAQADLAEAEQRLAQSKAESLAKAEEARFLLLQAESDLAIAELEARRNELLAAIVARQNDLAVGSARDRLQQLQTDLASRQATSDAGVAIQEAAVNKARVKAETAQKTIESMTLRAPRDGYVSLQQNQGSGFFSWGMQLPIYQVGDTVRPGMAVAQVLDLGGWELSARLAELDRGHLSVGQPARIRVAGVPGSRFEGRVKSIGNTSGPPWDRRFECKLSIENPSPDLRPGMSAEIEIETERIEAALWVPSQALFDRDGQKFVYRWDDGAFSAVDVGLVRAGESQTVIEGLAEGDVVALADPSKMQEAVTSSTATDALTNR
ncbi:MAG: HlyD family efflux transporter periplasmic adaptor subunit [Acidobacteria bacterium]|nr:HlyD family efflux transporter periplasmic adaptor subunit [Acidobacteriota bacterium]